MSLPFALSMLFAVSAVTYLSRAGMILFLADRTLPEPVMRALRNVGPAVLAALTISLVAGGDGLSGIEGVEVVALGVGGVVAALTRNLAWGLGAGMVALWFALALT